MERVVIIIYFKITSLQSFEGLGGGRNQKVVIHGCEKIRDFSRLNHLPILTIGNCPLFGPFQVRSVRELTIYPSQEMRFMTNFGTESILTLAFVQSLTLVLNSFFKILDG